MYKSFLLNFLYFYYTIFPKIKDIITLKLARPKYVHTYKAKLYRNKNQVLKNLNGMYVLGQVYVRISQKE